MGKPWFDARTRPLTAGEDRWFGVTVEQTERGADRNRPTLTKQSFPV